MQKMSTVGPLGGGARDPGAPTINAKNIDGGPLGRRCWISGSAHLQRKERRRWAPSEAMLEIWERPPSMQRTSMEAPLGGDAEDQGAPTINAKNVDGGPPKIWYRRSESGHQQRKKCQRWASWEVVPEIRERPPSTQKMLMVAPLGGSAGDLGALTINAKNVDGGPPRRRSQRFGSAHHQHKKC
jgi:hypothetical protein